MKQSIENLRSLIIGREEDGGVQLVEIDCSAWRKDYPHLTEYRIEVTSPNGIVYLPDVQMEGDILVWRITQADTLAQGRGLYQVVANGSDGNRKTSDHPAIVVLSIMEGTAQDTPPAPSKPWTDKVLDAAERAENAAKRAEYAASGSVTPEQIQEAVGAYLQENPVQVQETDPTVPEWAKQPKKPEYTAEEVGAMAATAEIIDTKARAGVAANAKAVDELSEEKLNKDFGAENAGAALIVGADGKVTVLVEDAGGEQTTVVPPVRIYEK